MSQAVAEQVEAVGVSKEEEVEVKKEIVEQVETERGIVKSKEKIVRRRGPKKIPDIIKEKLEEYDDERVLTIHFSPKILKKAPKWKRARKAARYVREFVLRYVKYVNYSGGEENIAKRLRILEPRVWISPEVNEILWQNGAENPPKRIRIHVLIKVDEVIRDEQEKPIGCSAEIRVFPIESKYRIQ